MALGESIGIRRVDGSGPIIALRSPSTADLNGLTVDPNSLTYMCIRDKKRMEHPTTFLEEIGPLRDGILWGVYCEDDGPEKRKMIGIASAGPITEPGQEIGLLLVEPGSRGRGVGRMVIAALVDDCFTRPLELSHPQRKPWSRPADMVYAKPHRDNEPMRRVLTALGFHGSATGFAESKDGKSGYWELYRHPIYAANEVRTYNPGIASEVEAAAAKRLATYTALRSMFTIEPIPMVWART